MKQPNLIQSFIDFWEKAEKNNGAYNIFAGYRNGIATYAIRYNDKHCQNMAKQYRDELEESLAVSKEYREGL